MAVGSRKLTHSGDVSARETIQNAPPSSLRGMNVPHSGRLDTQGSSAAVPFINGAGSVKRLS